MVTLNEVLGACGDGRDYFYYWHRAQRHLEAWRDFYAARDRRSDQWYYDRCEWNIRLIMGAWGGGKSTIMVVDGLGGNAEGIPCFHNGGPLYGWWLRGADIFTAMGRIPPCSKLKTDEAHTVAARRYGANTAVGAMKDLVANIRRKACQWDMATGHYTDIHPTILEDVVEVLEPVPLEKTGAEARPANLPPWDDPNNFLVGWKHWGNSPFKNREWRRDGLGEDHIYGWYEWPAVRNGFALNDSFGRNDWGAAMLSDREAVKENMRIIAGETLSPRGDGVMRSPVENAVLDFGKWVHDTLEAGECFEGPDGTPIHWVSGSEISRMITDPVMGDSSGDFEPRSVGVAMGRVLGVKRVRNKGYSLTDVAKAWEKEMKEQVKRL